MQNKKKKRGEREGRDRKEWKTKESCDERHG